MNDKKFANLYLINIDIIYLYIQVIINIILIRSKLLMPCLFEYCRKIRYL